MCASDTESSARGNDTFPARSQRSGQRCQQKMGRLDQTWVFPCRGRRPHRCEPSERRCAKGGAGWAEQKVGAEQCAFVRRSRDVGPREDHRGAYREFGGGAPRSWRRAARLAMPAGRRNANGTGNVSSLLGRGDRMARPPGGDPGPGVRQQGNDPAGGAKQAKSSFRLSCVRSRNCVHW